MKGVLVRVGIDSSCGFWNAPYDPRTGNFVYVPIPEEGVARRPNLVCRYAEVTSALEAMEIAMPSHLGGIPMHLDPDFEALTYGDVHPRSIPLLDLEAGDFIVFYAGLQPVGAGRQGLVYALIGFYAVKEVVDAADVPQARWHENAHTRRRIRCGDDVIVRAVKGRSGRFDRAIPIGEYRDRSYRVRSQLLKEWGGLTVKDGFIQRSGKLPEFLEPERFLKWLAKQGRHLKQRNNP